ncbi:MAG TPA: hypothetical protein VHM00_07325 [Caldimonas sp.]|nr:hypothetical protein [Caldimonas sp.]HEX2540880.1 hypothetical protein [Caldimonas sp.]
MDLAHWIAVGVVIGVATGAVASAAACRWWYGRKLAAASHRLSKSEKGRLFSQEQTQQAKRQIEALKKELAVVQLASADAQSSRQRMRELEEAVALAEPPAPADSGLMPLPVAHGFADTQVMP